MKPIVFREQLKDYSDQPDEQVDFNLFKIDFKTLLGCGLYGQVYPLTTRPKQEQTWYARHLTVLYDLSHPPIPTNDQTKYCIKLFKPVPYVLAKIGYFTLRSYLSKPYQLAIDSFSSKTQEYNSHKLLERYRLTSMRFYNGGGWWGQVKSKISGKTLAEYSHSKELIAKESFQMRRALYHFFIHIGMSPLAYFDVHARNIMFSPKDKSWLIVDGTVSELNANINQNDKNKQVHSAALALAKPLALIEKRLILALADRAVRRAPYSEAHDILLLNNIKRCDDDALRTNKYRLFDCSLNQSDTQHQLDTLTHTL
jgi:hypothetical protein